MKTQKAIVLMGGNQGEVYQTMMQAIRHISLNFAKVRRCSSIYSTQAWGPVPQPDFLNMVVELETMLSPGMLLKALLETEAYFGRRRTVKYGPRTLDLDILFFGNRIISRKDLTIPHPELQNRRFVLVPLNEIAPKYMHPVLHKTIEELLRNCQDQLEVNRWKR